MMNYRAPATATKRWASLRRLSHIAAVVLRHGLAHSLGHRLAGMPRLARHLPSGLEGPERLRSMLEDLGGSFLKLGQMLALQPDILSLEQCNALFKLLDKVEPFSYAELERTVIEELGSSPEEIFDAIDHEPLATASVGQVHVGYLESRKVAVKVQRPNVKTDFAGDIRLMRVVIRLIRGLRLKRLQWMIEPLSEFVSWTEEELDYRNEARYMEQLRRNAQHNSCESVPEVFWQLTTARVLVAEFFDGVTVLDYLRAVESEDEWTLGRLRMMNLEPSRFARNIIDNFLGDAFLHGLFHADLHPANLMILADNLVGYLDFGITGVLSQYSRKHLVAMTLSYTRGDVEGMCTSFFKVSAMGPNSDAKGFEDGLKRMADTWYQRQGQKRQLRKNFTLVMLDMLRLSRATGVLPERDVIKYIRSAIAIDGLITRFAPGFDVGQYLEAVCARHLRQQAQQILFSYEGLVEWSGAGGDLLRDGAFRAARFLERLSGGELPIQIETSGGNGLRNDLAALRALQLGATAFVVVLLMTTTIRGAELGFNLYTSACLLVGCALGMLLWTLRRLL